MLYQRPSSDPAKVGQTNEFLPATKAIEFIELHNPTTAAVDLGGWRLADAVDYLFPPGTVLAEGGYLCVGQNLAHFQAQFGFAPLGPWTDQLSRQKERIRLQNAAGVTVDEVNYEAGFPWPTAAKGGGESMELINPLLDHDLGGSWRSSGAGTGTATLISLTSANWHWRKGTSEASTPIEAWRAADFIEDGSWSTGAAPFGFGIAGIAFGTPLPDMMQDDSVGTPGYSSLYLRHPFTLAEGQLVSQLSLRIFIDDGCLVWLNGTQIASSLPPATPTFDAVAAGSNTSNGGTAVTVNVPNAAALLRPGQNVLAVQAFNVLKLSNDFRFGLELSSVVPNTAVRNPSPGRRNTAASSCPASGHPAGRAHAGATAGRHRCCGFREGQRSRWHFERRTALPEGRPWRLHSAVHTQRQQSRGREPRVREPANWTTLAMHDDGLAGDAVAGDSIFSATIPAAEQVHRRLVRYRVVATDGPRRRPPQ